MQRQRSTVAAAAPLSPVSSWSHAAKLVEAAEHWNWMLAQALVFEALNQNCQLSGDAFDCRHASLALLPSWTSSCACTIKQTWDARRIVTNLASINIILSHESWPPRPNILNKQRLNDYEVKCLKAFEQYPSLSMTLIRTGVFGYLFDNLSLGILALQFGLNKLSIRNLILTTWA